MKFKKRTNKFKGIIGPGFITGSADNDPSGIATYSQTGAQFGFSQLWMALFTLPLMISVQEMCTRISIVTRKGILKVLKENYPTSLVLITILMLSFTNIVNIGANINAMAECANLIYNINYYFYLIIFSAIILTLIIFVPYKLYSRILLFFALFEFIYILVAFKLNIEWNDVLKNLIPHFSVTKDYFLNIIAVLGTTISPYLFFWQSEQQIEEINHEKRTHSHKRAKKSKQIKIMQSDTALGMLASNVTMFFIILTTGSILPKQGITNIETASEAAKALEPLTGPFTSLIFSLGIIGLGLISVPVLAGSLAYVITEGFDIKQGLNKKFHEAKIFYLIIVFSVMIGVGLDLLPIKPFKMLYYSAALNGFFAPFLIGVIALIANNKKIMQGKQNGFISNGLVSFSIFVFLCSALFFLYSFF